MAHGAAATGLCLLLAAALAACDAPAAQAPVVAGQAVEVVSPRVQAVPRAVRASGTIAAWEEIGIGAEVSGLRVTEVAVEVGDTVRRGDLLVRLDARTQRAKVAQAEAAVAQAQASAAVAAKRAKRTRELASQDFVSRQDADQAEAEALNAEAQLRTMRSALEAVRVELGFTEIRAPQDGAISARNVQPGQVTGASDNLFRMIRDGRLEWRAEVTGSDLERVAPGMPVRLVGAGGATIEGRVRKVSPAVDARRMTGIVYADLPQPGPLRAGMFHAGSIVLGQAPGLVIPIDAVVRRDGRAYAYVVDRSDHARERRIRTASSVGASIDISEGLQPGDRVVSRGAGFLADGDLVRVVAPDAVGAAKSTQAAL
ncbi:efflux RND transporter periplasmic adaptor subunit [Lysobacter tyrosinilyticus]